MAKTNKPRVYSSIMRMRLDPVTVKRLKALAKKGRRSEYIRGLIQEAYERKEATKGTSDTAKPVL